MHLIDVRTIIYNNNNNNVNVTSHIVKNNYIRVQNKQKANHTKEIERNEKERIATEYRMYTTEQRERGETFPSQYLQSHIWKWYENTKESTES